MKFIANCINNNYLRGVLPKEKNDVERVYAAIAYGSLSTTEKKEEDFVSNCIGLGVRLDLWMRYDHTVPVVMPICVSVVFSLNKCPDNLVMHFWVVMPICVSVVFSLNKCPDNLVMHFWAF